MSAHCVVIISSMEWLRNVTTFGCIYTALINNWPLAAAARLHDHDMNVHINRTAYDSTVVHSSQAMHVHWNSRAALGSQFRH